MAGKPAYRASPKGDLARQRIVKEAIALFAARGFDGASLRQISVASEMPLSTLAHHFPHKRGLQEAAVRQAVANVADILIGAVDAEGGDAADRIAAYVRALVRALMSDSADIRLLDREIYSIAESRLLDVGIGALRTNAANLRMTEIYEQSGTDLLDRISARRLNDLIFAAVFGITKFRLLHQFDTDPAELTEEAIVAELMILIARYLHPDAAA